MPSAANGDVEKHASLQAVETSPVRRVVEILQSKITSLEKQKNKLLSNRDAKAGKDQAGEARVGCTKAEEINEMLEFTWDLCKQVMGIAVLSENEAKKVARKESALRKSQDTQLVHEVLLILDCLEQFSDPIARADFLAGECGASHLTTHDMEVLDNIYPEVTPKHINDDGEPVFQAHCISAAQHLMAIIEGTPKEVIGTTYSHIKSVVASVHDCGYFDHPREPEVKEEEAEIRQPEEEPPEEVEFVPPPPTPVNPAPPPPAPQAVPPPTFPVLPPRAPPVTLQQVEHAYFVQQYGHQQKQQQPIPEVFGPQSFIFLQESEIDTPDVTRQPTPRAISPGPIPSQTFTNQSFAIPTQHFTPELPPNAHIALGDIPQPPLYQPGMEGPAALIPGFPSSNPPPPIPMPPSHPVLPPHLGLAPAPPSLPRLPSPSFPQNITFKPSTPHAADQGIMAVPSSSGSSQDENPASPAHEQESREWTEGITEENQNSEQLEINEWNPSNDQGVESSTDNQSAPNKFRPRGRGRGGAPSGGYRGRGGYQNGSRSGGSYYRNDSYQSGGNNVNGNYNNDNYRDSNNRDGNNRYENSQGSGYQGSYKGRGGAGGRGSTRPAGPGTAPLRGGAPRSTPARGQRSQFPRKPTGNQQYESRGGVDGKQQYPN